ncbi:MAG TPA: hypothetical protein VFM43_09190 [Gaiellaceae bacterium]|nr:hypothetical protein [Gaiellaceae bacterium]
MPDRDSAAEHLVRGLASSTRHNALAYGYSLATAGAFGVLTALDGAPHVGEIFLFGAGGALTFTLATAGVTRGFRVGEEEEPRIVQALGASFGFLSVTGGIGAAALVGWASSGWIPWLVGPFAASSVYLLLGALEFVAARRISETADLELEDATEA